MRHTTISEVTLSRYGSLRQKAKAKEAEATRKAAAAAKDSAEAARLRKKAGELEVLAKKIGKGAIARDVLLQFETPRMMSDFGQAIRALGIPKEHHEAAAREILQAAVHGSAIKPKLDLWWDVRSGAAGKRLAAAERDQRMAKLRRMVHGGDINAFLVKLDADLGNMLRDLKIAADAAHFANANIRNRIVRQWPQYADLIALIVTRAGATSSEIIDVTPSKLLTHQEEAVA
jgi:hypothetical protein